MPKKKSFKSDEQPPICTSDFELFSASDTEAEDYSAASDQEWEVERVLGVQIDLQRKRRYEVQWKDWQRADGSNTTWEHLLDEESSVVRQGWERTARKEREEKAKLSGEINIDVISKHLPHDIHTAEESEAYEEKLARWSKEQSNVSDWDEEIEQVQSRHFRAISSGTGSSRTLVARENCLSTTASQNSGLQEIRKRKRRLSNDSDALRSSSSSSVAGPSTINREHSSSPSNLAIPSLNAKPRSNNPSSLRDSPRTRTALESEWNKVARQHGAAAITIVNEYDTEECPRISKDFQYLERTCLYGDDVPHPFSFESFLHGCECEDGCIRPLICECQNENQFEDDHGELSRAYDNNRHFLFHNDGKEVIECNPKCACGDECSNRVAQKSRDIPLQIFKTESNGWGIRCPVDILKGKVLGLYTGKIITREVADGVNCSGHTYLFNLDTRDNENDDDLKRYSVDASKCGNWSRFVNHSCDPNASVYSVVFDNVLENNMPYIALVANQFIPAWTELTVDYTPSIPKRNAKDRGKGKIPAGTTRCKCGSDLCRGWLY